MNVNTARQTSVRADKSILLYIIVGVNQLSCEPETLNIIKLLYILCVVYKLFGETNQLTIGGCEKQPRLRQPLTRYRRLQQQQHG